MSVVINQTLVASPAIVPLNHARIAWDHITATASATSEAVGYPASNVTSAETYKLWKPTALPATLTLFLGGPTAVNYIGLAAHELAGFTVTAEVQIDSVWLPVASAIPENNRPILFLFPTKTAPFVRISISGTGNGTVSIPRVGVMCAGVTLDMQRPIYSGHEPQAMALTDIVTTTQAERGQFLGRTLIRAGTATTYEWQYLTADWVRQNIEPLFNHLQTQPLFIAWNPQAHPDEVFYSWANGQPRAVNAGGRNFMTVTIPLQGLGNE